MIPRDNHLYEFEPFVLDAGSRILLKDGATVRLTPKALETLLVLVQTFGGWELIAEAYRQAIAEEYRFYSYGDAMLIV